jgi:hypothetical protein
MAGTGRARYHSRRSCPGRRRRPSGSVWGGVRTRLELGQHGAVHVIGRRAPGTEELVWLAVVLSAARDDASAAAALSDALRWLRAHPGT